MATAEDDADFAFDEVYDDGSFRSNANHDGEDESNASFASPTHADASPRVERGRSVTFDESADQGADGGSQQEAARGAAEAMKVTAKTTMEFQASTQTMLRRQSSAEWTRPRQGSSDSLERKVSPQDFKLLKVIGQGAYGRVFQVRHNKTDDIFAMKVLAKGQVLEKNNMSYVREERNILSKTNHPFVVQLMCAFQTPSKLYLVMEYVSGGELFSHLREEGLFEEHQARFYAAEIILAIEYMHQNGIIHRDLKPENVLLDSEGHIRITDFGLATENRVEARTLCGTDLYMAPEMIAGHGYGKAVDYWSLGAILFEMLTGDTPFYAKDTKRLYRLILSSKPRFPRWLSKDCISLLRGLLNRNVEQRLGASVSTMFKVGGVSALKEHEFFAKLDWNALLALQIDPPFRPQLQEGILDTSNFSENFTKLAPEALHDEADSEEAQKLLEEASSSDFAGFSFTHPNYIEKAMTMVDSFNLSEDEQAEDKDDLNEPGVGETQAQRRDSTAKSQDFAHVNVPSDQPPGGPRGVLSSSQFSYRDMVVKAEDGDDQDASPSSAANSGPMDGAPASGSPEASKATTRAPPPGLPPLPPAAAPKALNADAKEWTPPWAQRAAARRSTSEFVAFEKRLSCDKCGNAICSKCVREVEEKDAGGMMDAGPASGESSRLTICKDCEFMGKWVNDVQSKDKGRFWNIKMPTRFFKRKGSTNKMPGNLNQKFSMVNSMLEKSRAPNSRTVAVTVPDNIQQDLHALSREKIKELHEQKKLISSLQEENERMRAGGVDSTQLHEMKRMIDELKRESEAHIVQLQQKVDELNTENARLRDGASPAMPAAAAAPVVQEDPKFAKFRKMQKAGLPEGAIMQAAGRDGIDLPHDFFTAPAPTAAPAPAAAAVAAPVVQEDPKFAKFRKMQKAGLPEGAIMQAAGRDGIELPATFFSGPVPAAAPAAAPVVQEDPKFAKYRKMQRAGLPEGAIMQAAGRDGVDLPATFFSGPAPAAAPAAAPVQEDPKFAKYRKMQKAKLPDGAIIQAASRDGIELPASFFSGEAPAPPALPGAPSPPPLPGMGASSAAAAKPKEPEKPKSKYELTKRENLRRANDKPLRGVFWNVLPAARVEKSMWPSLSDAPPFPIDKHLNVLEEKFSKVQAKAIVKNTDKAAKPAGSDRPPLLDSKRQQNLGIAIARFKEPVPELRDHILKLDSDFFTMEVVHKLISMVPTPEEIQAVQAAEGEWTGPGRFDEGLTRVEQFVYEMSKIPRLRQRLQCVFVEMSFERQSESLQESISKYESAVRQLRDSKGWKQLLHLALTAGNYVNSGNKSTGGAWGFEISTGLQKLAQSKATGNSKYSLLHWLAEVCEARAPQLFELPKELNRLEEASVVKIEDLKADLAQLSKGCDLVERELKASSGETLGSPSTAPGARAFCTLMNPFLKEHGRPVTEQIKASMVRLEKMATELLEAHGEVPSKCSSSQLLATAMHFCKNLVRAREENIVAKNMEEKKEAAASKKKKNEKVAPKLAANAKQLDKQIKVDKLNKKLKNSFKKKGTKTEQNNNEFQAQLGKLKTQQQRPASCTPNKNNLDPTQSA
ncbi:Protein kinase, putative [Hondaea fermentalgiana]|uniref:Protein kinase, putative n=1 Tax=Hondaea fermentalgiana TaxID=2315210 RepID=A0A2R5G7U2_9STRA|nr:Protein kinase, putative [Hondaea fermentalgiana]|eukprot:GBG25868.1 Protein kinase, putative [Hondaea fermentalgiana]